MKKILLACGLTAAVMTMTSCGGSSSQAGSADDSLSNAIGEFNGAQLCMQYNQLPDEMKAKFDKKQMLEGIRSVLTVDTTRSSYMTGVQIGLQLWQQLYQMESLGVKIDAKKVLAAYEKAFMADSVADMSAIAANHQALMGKAQERMMAARDSIARAEEEAKKNSPEAKKNVAEGAAYIKKQKAADPSIVIEKDGLAYKVIKQGTGATAGPNSRVKVKYSGKLVNGTEFDSNDAATFPVRGVIPGFSEALQKMNKGSHYIIYIPGDLAYGPNGTPDGSIPPMATLIFDVEVLDIEDGAAAPTVKVEPQTSTVRN